MTENKKRFWLNSDDGLLNGIYNIFDEHNVLDGNEIVELLNALHKENEELKRDVEETLQKKYTHYLNMQKTLGHNKYANSVYINILKVLKDTSEQLGVDVE